MSQPAGLRRRTNPFVKPKKKSGSKKLGLNLEKIEFSDNHREEARVHLRRLTSLRTQLIEAELEGKRSKANKLRRAISQETEHGLYLSSSFCGGCHNTLHLCTC